MYINGTEVGSSPAVAALLVSQMVDRSAGVTRVGQNLEGLQKFTGRIQDLRAYSDTLSNRHVTLAQYFLFSGLQDWPDGSCLTRLKVSSS